jgi:hypothetical protein
MTMASTFRQEYIRCGKANCRRCPHGPYWYEYWHQGGKLRKKYHGKQRPEAAPEVTQDTTAIARLDAIFSRRLATMEIACEILHVKPGASRSEIMRLYKALCFANHPDRGGDLRTMQRINAAKSFLLG